MRFAPSSILLDGSSLDAGVAAELVNVEDYRFAVRSALLVITAVELVPCGDSSVMARLLDNLRLVSVAKAHGAFAPWSYVVPQVIDLLTGDKAVDFEAHMEPPPDRYCALRLLSGPADMDAEGVVEYPEMVAKALRVEGMYSHSSLADVRSLQVETSLQQAVVLPFESGELDLSAGSPRARLRLVANNATMFDGVIPPDQDPTWLAHAVQLNLLSQFQLEMCEPDGCSN